jgi:glycosidase
MLLVALATVANAAHTASVPPRLKQQTDIVLNVGGMMIRASPNKPDAPLRLRGGGGAHAAPKYPSNIALKQDEYAAPYGTIMRTRSGAMIAPTPTPEWFEQGVMYQIYPLGTPGEGGGGFFGGVPATNDLTTKPTQKLLLLRKWYEHIKTLGVTSIYFSPLFESETHGYDTVDYFMIDRRVGDLESFKAILRELHELGIKVILDGVFNHTGRMFFAFQEIVKAGANWEQCEYKDWYFISEGNSTYGDAFAYRSWEGHEELPELNVENEQVRQYLFKVAKFWLQMGVDGWRLDVAHELPPAFWRDFRTACTEANPEHVLLGEVIHGDYNTWVGPGKGLLHSGTNYQVPPTPYTLHPTPYILHPYTLHPILYTLHPAPYALRPTPYTLPPPYILSLAP